MAFSINGSKEHLLRWLLSKPKNIFYLKNKEFVNIIFLLPTVVLGKNIWSRHRFNTTECYDRNFWPRNARIKVQCHCTPKDSLDKWYWMDRLNTIRHLLSGNTNEHHVLKVEYMQEEPILKNYFKIDYISPSWFHVIILRVKLDFNLVVIKLYMHQHSNQVLLQ